MKFLQEIKSFLIKAQHCFNDLSFKVGYENLDKTFIIEVSPSSEYDCNEKFANMMLDFSDDFEMSHPQYTIIFKREDEILFKVKDVVLEIKNTTKELEYPQLQLENNLFKFCFESIQNNEWMEDSKNKYALAA